MEIFNHDSIEELKFLPHLQIKLKYMMEKLIDRTLLHRKRTKVPKADDDKAKKDEVPEKVSRMAIGVPGGFNPDEKKFDFVEENSVVLMPGFKTFPLDDPDIPLAIQGPV